MRRFPGFPVEFVCVDELHAAFLNESRTPCGRLVPNKGKPGLGRLEKKKEKI